MFPADNADFRRKKSAQTSLARLAVAPAKRAGEAGQRNQREILWPRIGKVDFMDRH